ncbi:MAG: integrase [Acidobacteria bacterium]|nr:MAG: integrase [Acidobacteriota bacterium]
MFGRAVEWGHLAQHPLRAVKALREDKTGRLRYLSVDEERRLRQALEARDLLRRQDRESANAWRRARGYEEWPAYGEYTDNLRPMVILSLDTGMRFGELCALRWADVQMDLAFLTVRGVTAKNGTTRHIPLNAEALEVLRTWHPAEIDDSTFVFSGRTDDPIVDIKTAWLPLVREQANIANFRFHDLRHTFASKLVMAGVDLNTVRELLGHADIKMTLRYAHLAPEHKAAAVAKLVAP